MDERELKEVACNAAYQLIKALDKIQDEDFVEDVISAVTNNDEILLVELMYDE